MLMNCEDSPLGEDSGCCLIREDRKRFRAKFLSRVRNKIVVVAVVEVRLGVQNRLIVNCSLVQLVSVQYPDSGVGCRIPESEKQSGGKRLRPVEQSCRQTMMSHDEKSVPRVSARRQP